MLLSSAQDTPVCGPLSRRQAACSSRWAWLGWLRPNGLNERWLFGEGAVLSELCRRADLRVVQ